LLTPHSAAVVARAQRSAEEHFAVPSSVEEALPPSWRIPTSDAAAHPQKERAPPLPPQPQPPRTLADVLSSFDSPAMAQQLDASARASHAQMNALASSAAMRMQLLSDPAGLSASGTQQWPPLPPHPPSQSQSQLAALAAAPPSLSGSFAASGPGPSLLSLAALSPSTLLAPRTHAHADHQLHSALLDHAAAPAAAFDARWSARASSSGFVPLDASVAHRAGPAVAASLWSLAASNSSLTGATDPLPSPPRSVPASPAPSSPGDSDRSQALAQMGDDVYVCFLLRRTFYAWLAHQEQRRTGAGAAAAALSQDWA
jgi:hypothetical protein